MAPPSHLPSDIATHTMPFLHPVFALLPLLSAFLFIKLSFRWRKETATPAHFETIDGLRGYLAFFVFVHHAAVFYRYAQTGVMTPPASRLYTHLGQSSVVLFFMITSFLFYEKLLQRQAKAFSWKGFFIGRVFRLFPLYAAVMMVTFVIVAIVSAGVMAESPVKIVINATRWLLFTIPGAPRINHVQTGEIVASVIWTLPFEWYFYCILPLIALTTGQRPPWAALGVSCAWLAYDWYTGTQRDLALVFLGGIIAARVVRHGGFVRFARTPFASVLTVLSLIAAASSPTAYATMPAVFLTIAFCLIAGGASLFGLLLTHTSRRLGTMAYSIYLTHGMLLYIMVNFVFGRATIASLSSIQYWLLIVLLVPVLLAVSGMTFRFIEQPGIQFGRRFSRPALPAATRALAE